MLDRLSIHLLFFLFLYFFVLVCMQYLEYLCIIVVCSVGIPKEPVTRPRAETLAKIYMPSNVKAIGRKIQSMYSETCCTRTYARIFYGSAVHAVSELECT